jgi:tRNA pseudouridine55 synthase
MLPLCFGEATKVCAFLLDADKTYRVTARLGIATDTGDADGTETAQADVPELSSEQWVEILRGFMGESMQIPPMYSALKKDGKRLYELARRGQTVERKPRPIRIDAISLLEIMGNRLVFRVHCSKGTYIRTLVEDIAGRAGTVAHTARLHRETVGGFRADEMLDMAGIEELAAAGSAGLRECLLAPDKALESMPAVPLDQSAAGRFQMGQEVAAELEGVIGLVRVYGGDTEFLGVGELSAAGSLAPRRVFRTGEKNP